MRKNSGLTLIELLLSVTIGSFVVGSIYAIVSRQAKTSTQSIQTSQNLRDAQRAHFLMRLDLAHAGFDPRYYDNPPPSCGSPRPSASPCPLFPITTASNDRIVVHGDYNMNGTIDANDQTALPETIDYLYDASSRQLTRNGSVFLQGVTGFTIRYENSSSQAIADPQTNVSQIKKVRIQWTQEVSESKTESYELLVQLKNNRS